MPLDLTPRGVSDLGIGAVGFSATVIGSVALLPKLVVSGVSVRLTIG